MMGEMIDKRERMLSLLKELAIEVEGTFYAGNYKDTITGALETAELFILRALEKEKIKYEKLSK